jgi:hypothetical protein
MISRIRKNTKISFISFICINFEFICINFEQLYLYVVALSQGFYFLTQGGAAAPIMIGGCRDLGAGACARLNFYKRGKAKSIGHVYREGHEFGCFKLRFPRRSASNQQQVVPVKISDTYD